MDAEQLKTLLESLIPALMTKVEGVGQTGQGSGGEFGGERKVNRILDEKMFQRLEKFAGDEKAFKEWEYNMKVILNSNNSLSLKTSLSLR